MDSATQSGLIRNLGRILPGPNMISKFSTGEKRDRELTNSERACERDRAGGREGERESASAERKIDMEGERKRDRQVETRRYSNRAREKLGEK